VAWEAWRLGLLFLYLAVRALVGAVVRSRRGLDVKGIELLRASARLEILRAAGRAAKAQAK
jgi:hypothetical protein